MTQIKDWAVYSVAVYLGLLLGGAMIHVRPAVTADALAASEPAPLWIDWDAHAGDDGAVEPAVTSED